MVFDQRDVLIAGTLVALMIPAPLLAEPTMELPDGCAGFLTIQLENCTLFNHWRCDADPADTYWVTTFDETQTPTRQVQLDGLSPVKRSAVGNRPAAIVETTDPEDYETLIETGIDTYDYVWKYNDSDVRVRVQGESILTGETTVIDGVFLRGVQSTSQFTYPSGQLDQKTVMQYVTPTMPIWVPDRIVGNDNDDALISFGPVDFIWPEEPGFMSRVPNVNCSRPLS